MGALLVAIPAAAQQAESAEQPASMQQGIAQTPAAVTSYDDVPYRWNISFGAGTISGATPIGSATDAETGRITTFEIGNGTLFNARVARRFWWRVAGEFEIGHGSPGVDAAAANDDGSNRQEFAVTDYDVTYGAVSVRLDLTDARVTPFMLLGVAVISGDTGDGSNTNPGLLFGGGFDVRIRDRVYLRGDVKGLRSDADATLLTRGAVMEASARSTQFLWTVGLAVRF